MRLILGQVERRNGDLEFSKRTEVEAQVDTGATFSCLPSKTLSICDVVPERAVALKLADGREVERKLGHIWMVVEGVRVHTPVLFGEPGDPSLLGLLALEEANLMVDPARPQDVEAVPEATRKVAPASRRLIRGTAYTHYSSTSGL